MDREGSENEDSGRLYSPNYSQSLASVSVKRTECSIDKKGGGEGLSSQETRKHLLRQLCAIADGGDDGTSMSRGRFARSRENSRQKKKEMEKKKKGKKREGTHRTRARASE